jgi:hypothetical protein
LVEGFVKNLGVFSIRDATVSDFANALAGQQSVFAKLMATPKGSSTPVCRLLYTTETFEVKYTGRQIWLCAEASKRLIVNQLSPAWMRELVNGKIRSGSDHHEVLEKVRVAAFKDEQADRLRKRLESGKAKAAGAVDDADDGDDPDASMTVPNPEWVPVDGWLAFKYL